MRCWASCFNACLKEGRFPAEWKVARLVLLKKGNKPEGLPSSYRPICLLDEAGKFFERILALVPSWKRWLIGVAIRI